MHIFMGSYLSGLVYIPREGISNHDLVIGYPTYFGWHHVQHGTELDVRSCFLLAAFLLAVFLLAASFHLAVYSALVV